MSLLVQARRELGSSWILSWKSVSHWSWSRRRVPAGKNCKSFAFCFCFYLFYIHANCKRFLDKFHGPEEEIIVKSDQSSFTWTQLSWWRCPRLGWLTRWDHKAAELLHHLATRDQLGGFSVSSRFLSLHKKETWRSVDQMSCTPCSFSLLSTPFKQCWGGHNISAKRPTYIRCSCCRWKA